MIYNKEQRKEIYEDTLEYSTQLLKENKIKPLKKSTKHKLIKQDISKQYSSKYNKTKINVLNQDVIKTVIDLNQELIKSDKLNSKILVLNLASEKHFGGGAINGAMAQEEELFRKTNYGLHTGSELYPLKINEFVYTPNVSIIKNENYERLTKKEIFQVDMLAMPALRRPRLINGELSDRDFDLTLNKISSIFKFAILNNITDLVLGAMGCGVFKNPPLDIIEIYNMCLETYDKYFNNIIFSIKSINDDNYELFNKNIVRIV